jgi:hypothetical protein
MLNDRMISEQWIGKDEKGIVPRLIYSTVMACARRDGKTLKNHSWASWYLGQDINMRPFKYEDSVLTSWLWH